MKCSSLEVLLAPGRATESSLSAQWSLHWNSLPIGAQGTSLRKGEEWRINYLLCHLAWAQYRGELHQGVGILLLEGEHSQAQAGLGV